VTTEGLITNRQLVGSPMMAARQGAISYVGQAVAGKKASPWLAECSIDLLVAN
jgi:hypothetical protein